jgi:hypothetical protein
MNNIHLHIIGSKPFFNLLDELDLKYTFSLDDKFRYNDHHKLIARIIFVKNVNLTKLKRYFQENLPTIFVLDNNEFLKKNKLQLLQLQYSIYITLQ